MKEYKSAVEIIICDLIWIIISVFSYMNLDIRFSLLSTVLISAALVILTILVFIADDETVESGEIAKEGETAADGGETCKKRIVRIFFFAAIALAVVGALWMIFGRWFY